MSGFDQQAFDAWIHDLRTTTAKQGRGVLRNGSNEFCCLGRAIEVLHPNEWERRTFCSVFWFAGDSLELPASLQSRLGIDIDLTVCKGDYDELRKGVMSLHEYLINLNDAGFSFKFIANVAASMIERFKREGKLDAVTNA